MLFILGKSTDDEEGPTPSHSDDDIQNESASEQVEYTSEDHSEQADDESPVDIRYSMFIEKGPEDDDASDTVTQAEAEISKAPIKGKLS